MKIGSSLITVGSVILLLSLMACNLSTPPQATPEAIITESNAPHPALETITPAAPASVLTPPISHILFPADAQTTGAIIYDVDSSVTAAENRAPYGDAYLLNILERPFTQNAMEYLPDVDILKFRLHNDQDWYYVFMEVSGVNPDSGTLGADYGVELDIDRDGYGDHLIWAKPPYTTAWKAEGVSVYEDTDNDCGGILPGQSDAPFNGNGYDLNIFNSGLGTDPDLAWVRIAPNSPTTIQFAFKKALAGDAFMWGVWADIGLKDPTKFNYNDYFTEQQAGSPEKGEQVYYPVKSVHSLDNTCRDAFGFSPTGNEPFLCTLIQPKTDASGEGRTCINPRQYGTSFSCVAAGCEWIPSLTHVGGGYCTYP